MAILSPIQNGAVFDLNWIQTRPVITQRFGLNQHIYSQFGLKGHNGIDFRAKVGTPIFAPISGEIKIKDNGTQGYGLHVRIRNPYKACECVLGHLSSANVVKSQKVNMGDVIGYSGNTGFSTGPHLHMGYRLLKPGKNNQLWDWKVLEYDNGYFGYFDFEEFMITWKGGYLSNSF